VVIRPDFGVPRATNTIRKVLSIIDSHNASGSPILVHCSAGMSLSLSLSPPPPLDSY